MSFLDAPAKQDLTVGTVEGGWKDLPLPLCLFSSSLGNHCPLPLQF